MFWQKILRQKLFKISYPLILQENCINNKYNISSDQRCDICAKSCPYGALEIKNGKIFLKKEYCVGCGNCCAVCPSKAIKSTNIDYDKAFTELSSKKNPLLGCYWFNSKVDYTFPCLFSVSHDFWQAITIKHGENGSRIGLYLAQCSDCDNLKNYPNFLDGLKNARLLLTDLGVNCETNITGIFNDQELSSFRKLYKQITDKTNCSGYYTRRELFRNFRRETAGTIYDFTNDLVNVQSNRKTSVTETEEPERNILLGILKNYSNHSINSRTRLTMAWFKINSDCNGCGICVKNCGTKALVKSKNFSEQSQWQQITHHPYLCIDCGVCRHTCPRNAISKVVFTEQLSELMTEQLLINLTKIKCRRCGIDILIDHSLARENNKQLCQSCQKKSQIVF